MAAKNENKAVTEDVMEPVYIPKEYPKDDSQFVSVNGRRWLIQKGKTVLVPPEVAEVLRNANLMNEKAQAYIDGLTA